jgi:hypothetical protein
VILAHDSVADLFVASRETSVELFFCLARGAFLDDRCWRGLLGVHDNIPLATMTDFDGTQFGRFSVCVAAELDDFANRGSRRLRCRFRHRDDFVGFHRFLRRNWALQYPFPLPPWTPSRSPVPYVLR